MTLKERLNAKETKLGQILKTWVAGILLLCSALGAANEYLVLFPPDIVPLWLKSTVLISGLISFVVGKLTVHTDEKTTN